MKEKLKNLLFSMVGVFGSSKYVFQKLLRLSNLSIHIPYYHAINDNLPPHLRHITPIKSAEQFAADLEFFSSHYHFVSIPNLVNHLYHNAPLPENAMTIAFDDGLSDAYQFAAPLLEQFNASAVFFLNSDFLDNKKMFYRHKESLLVEYILKSADSKLLSKLADEFMMKENFDSKNICKKILSLDYNQSEKIDHIGEICEIDFNDYLEKEKPYMSTNDVEDLISRGFFIGAHSLDHADFRLLSFEDQITQAVESTQIIAQKFNLPYKIFSSPFHNDYLSKNFFEEIYSSGIQVAFGIDGTMTDEVENSLQRLNMESEKLYKASALLATYYVVKIFRGVIGKGKIHRSEISNLSN